MGYPDPLAPNPLPLYTGFGSAAPADTDPQQAAPQPVAAPAPVAAAPAPAPVVPMINGAPKSFVMRNVPRGRAAAGPAIVPPDATPAADPAPVVSDASAATTTPQFMGPDSFSLMQPAAAPATAKASSVPDGMALPMPVADAPAASMTARLGMPPAATAAPATSPTIVPFTPAATAPTATAPAPMVAPAVPTGQPPADDSSSDALIASLSSAKDDTAGEDDTADDARAQYQRDQAATNKYLRAQGAQMQVTPTGQTQPATDAQGNVLYKGAVIQPFVRGDDGEGYRVSRDEYGNQHYFRIADGEAGTDFHVDPETGEQYTRVAGSDGTSRREVIGQDNFVPLQRDIQAQLAGHRAVYDQSALAVNRAEEGVDGAPGYGSVPLSDLQTAHQSLSKQVESAQDYMSKVDQAIRAGGRLTPQELQTLRGAQSTISQYGDQMQDLSDEIGARKSAITAARQQRTAAAGNVKDAASLFNRARTPEFRQQVQDDLTGAISGAPVDPDRAETYQRIGLLAPTQAADGSTSYQVTDRGMSLLPRQVQQTVRTTQARQGWQAQQAALLSEFPRVGKAGSPENATFTRAFQAAGSDPRRALQVARAVLGQEN